MSEFYVKFFVDENAERRRLMEQIGQARFELAMRVRKLSREQWLRLSHLIDEFEYSELTGSETADKRLS